MKTAGILVTAIGGGIGVGGVVIGSMMNTCAGAFGDSKKACQKNAADVVAGSLLLTAVSAAVGIPLIAVGSHRYKAWKKLHEGDDSLPTPPPRPADAREGSDPVFSLALATIVF